MTYSELSDLGQSKDRLAAAMTPILKAEGFFHRRAERGSHYWGKVHGDRIFQVRLSDHGKPSPIIRSADGNIVREFQFEISPDPRASITIDKFSPSCFDLDPEVVAQEIVKAWEGFIR